MEIEFVYINNREGVVDLQRIGQFTHHVETIITDKIILDEYINRFNHGRENWPKKIAVYEGETYLITPGKTEWKKKKVKTVILYDLSITASPYIDEDGKKYYTLS